MDLDEEIGDSDDVALPGHKNFLAYSDESEWWTCRHGRVHDATCECALYTLSSFLLVLATACGSNVPEGATSGSGGDALSDATATTSSSDESSSVAVASSSSGTGGGSAETCSPSNACGALPNCAPFVSANKDGGLTAEGGNLSKIKNGTYFMTWFWNGKTQQDFTFATTLTIAGEYLDDGE